MNNLEKLENKGENSDNEYNEIYRLRDIIDLLNRRIEELKVIGMSSRGYKLLLKISFLSYFDYFILN